MKTVVGIDEAGYGPTLGPLTLGVTAFRLAEDGPDLPRRLAPLVTDRTGAAADTLRVGDSKRLYGGGRGLGALELPVLAFLDTCPVPGPLEGLLPEDLTARAPPWYRPRPGAAELPRAVRPDAVRRFRVRLAERFRAAGIAGFHGRVEPVLEPRFNALVERTGNKAQAHLELVGALLREVTLRYPADDLEVQVDRLGGRRFYGGLLGGLFPFARCTVEGESATESRYVVREGGRRIRVSFAVKSDARHLPVALASMAAKYVRELLLVRLNAYFGARLPGLLPTAGYPVDARRFLRDLAPVLAADERRLLVRRR